MSCPDKLDVIRVAADRRVFDEGCGGQPHVDADRYAPWQAGEAFRHERRRRLAAEMLHRAGAFPQPHHHCLEVGYGTLGRLAELIDWSVPLDHLHGIELDAQQAEIARRRLPSADLRVGDARDMPWPDSTFQLVIASTLFSSISDTAERKMVAREITRVLTPGGALLCYDFAVGSPGNPRVRKLTRRELAALFPDFHGQTRSLSLAPPIARAVAPRCWLLATMLEMIPLLRTHLLAVLIKRPAD